MRQTGWLQVVHEKFELESTNRTCRACKTRPALLQSHIIQTEFPAIRAPNQIKEGVEKLGMSEQGKIVLGIRLATKCMTTWYIALVPLLELSFEDRKTFCKCGCLSAVRMCTGAGTGLGFDSPGRWWKVADIPYGFFGNWNQYALAYLTLRGCLA